MQQNLTQLIEENCFSPSGWLSRWPDWLDYAMVVDMVEGGLLTKTFDRWNYGQTDFYLPR